MRTSFITAALAASVAIAAPLERRNMDSSSTMSYGSATGTSSAAASSSTASSSSSSSDIDPTVLNFALTLEHLEATFYKEGIAKYSAQAFQDASYPDWVRYRLSEIGSQEATHVSFLSSALEAAGATPVKQCTYSFPDNSPETFLQVAQILEGVGISAYAGAAKLITNKDYLQAAATILSVEARHNAWIRGGAQHEDSFPSPFDIPLDPTQAYSLAAPFIKSCPSDSPALPFTAFPTLNATAYDNGYTTLSYANQSASDYAVFITAMGQEAVQMTSDGKIKIPSDLHGQNYIVITKSNETVTDGNTVAGPAYVEIPLQATEYYL